MNCKSCGRIIMVGDEICGFCRRDDERKAFMRQILNIQFVK